MKKTTTIQDVAEKAHVTRSTVSRVLNNKPGISEKTRERVMQAVEALHYEPNRVAQGLTNKRTYTLGVILEDILNPFFASVAKGIECTLKKHGFSMLLTSSDFEYDDEIKLIRILLQHRVDGVLITPITSSSESIQILKERRVPFFIMNCSSTEKDVSWIESDNFEGGYIATKYLLELGHRRFINIQYTRISSTMKRFEGFKKALSEYGLRLSDQVILGEAVGKDSGYELMSKFLEKTHPRDLPTAIVCVNDMVAIGAMSALYEYNIRIPDRISIIGYDDLDIAGLLKIPLTTINQPKFRMGEIAANQLIDMINRDEEDVARQFLIQPTLVERSSCTSVSQQRVEEFI